MQIVLTVTFYVEQTLRYILEKEPPQNNLRKLETKHRGHAVHQEMRLEELNTMLLSDTEYFHSEKSYGAAQFAARNFADPEMSRSSRTLHIL